MFRWIIVKIVAFLICFNLFAQEENEFILGNKVYRKNAPWFELGQGIGYNFYLGQKEWNTSFSYSFMLKKTYFQVGYHISSDVILIKSSMQRLNDFYLTIGKRKESRYYNFSIFAGGSYAYGGVLDHTERKENIVIKWYRGFSQPGLFVRSSIVFKPIYDIGFGLSLYWSVNRYYNVTGIQLQLYLSGSYKATIE